MSEEYKAQNEDESLEKIAKDILLENDIYGLVTLTIEASFYYDSNNKLVITKNQSQVAKEVNERLDKYCRLKCIDKKLAIEIAKKAIRNNNELRFNPTERKMAMDLLGIEDDEER